MPSFREPGRSERSIGGGARRRWPLGPSEYGLAVAALSAVISAANSDVEVFRTARAARMPPRGFLLAGLRPPGDGALCIPYAVSRP